MDTGDPIFDAYFNQGSWGSSLIPDVFRWLFGVKKSKTAHVPGWKAELLPGKPGELQAQVTCPHGSTCTVDLRPILEAGR